MQTIGGDQLRMAMHLLAEWEDIDHAHAALLGFVRDDAIEIRQAGPDITATCIVRTVGRDGKVGEY